jgi:hypothetical protein
VCGLVAFVVEYAERVREIERSREFFDRREIDQDRERQQEKQQEDKDTYKQGESALHESSHKFSRATAERTSNRSNPHPSSSLLSSVCMCLEWLAFSLCVREPHDREFRDGPKNAERCVGFQL